MKKSILEIYALAVCFAAIVCSAIALGFAIYNVIEIMNPEFTMSAHEYEHKAAAGQVGHSVASRARCGSMVGG